MVSISRDPSINTKVDEIRLLHNSLSKIGYIIDSKEKTKKIFGKTTEKAVRKFQSENGLKITGKANILTANKIKKIAKSVVTEGGHRKSEKAAKNNNIMKKTKSKKMMQIPRSLLESEVFFKSLEDSNVSKLKKDEAEYIDQKLNKYFQNELLLGLIDNKINENLLKQLDSHIVKLNYTKYTDFTPLQALNEVLTEVENKNSKSSSLRQDISKIKESLSSSFATSASSSTSISAPLSITADQKIGELLDLKIPLRDNHIFRDELNIEKTRHYIRLAKLNSSSENRLLEAKMDFYQFPREVIFDLVKSNVISEKQAHSLKNIGSMARLTGDNPKFVRLLSENNIKSVADLTSWKNEDWEKFIVEQEIPLPTNVTSTKTYAENIRFNIERSYPTQILLTTVSDSSKVSSTDSHLIDSVNTLLTTNDKLIESGDIAVVNWNQINITNKLEIKKSLDQLISFSNSYKHLGIQDIINNKIMSTSEKKAAIETTINHISTFNINNTEVDLRLLNFFDKDEMLQINWNNIPPATQPRIRKQMMAYQRILILSDQSSDHKLLMAKGYDSAISIGRMTQHEFETTSGLEPDRARIVYFKAQQQLIHTTHNFEAVRDVARGEFQRIRMSNINPSLVNDLRDIDGFDELFGSQNYCSCQDCMSILSPAAYFVDLMRFIHDNISTKTFLSTNDPQLERHPLYLKNRRRDLWQMQINCENTHTLIPYLNIVNDVLQSYLENVVPMLGGATTNRNIFEILSKNSQDTNISFLLPFNLPVEEIQLYLNHFGISIFDIYSIFSQNSSGDEKKIWRSKLGLSKEQFDVIVTPDTINVKFRYGESTPFSSFPVLDFLQSSGLYRHQLDELLQIKFNTDLANIKIEKIVEDTNELQNFKEILNNLDDNKLDFIHRFIQLLRRTKWSIPELDMVLIALNNRDIIEKSIINSDAVTSIAKFLHIKENLKFDVEELRCMIDRLPLSASYPDPPPNGRDKKFFECIFDVKNLFENPLFENPDTHIIDPSTKFHHYSFNKKDENDIEVDPKMPLLLSGLGISEPELVLLFKLLIQRIPFDDDGNCTLGLRKISLLYRHVRLARALKFDSIQDFITAISICFNISPTLANPIPVFVIDSIDKIFKMIEFRNWLKASPFDVNEIFLILHGQENSFIQFSTSLQTIIMMVQKIQQEIENSKETEKNKLQTLEQNLLKAAISTLVNVSSDHLEQRIFPWVKRDPKSDEIENSLKTKFDANGNPIPINNLDPLIDMIHEIERVMLIFSNLKFTEKTIDKIAKPENHLRHLGIDNLKDLTLENLQSLMTYHRILDSMIDDKEKRDSDKSIGKLLDDYLAHSPHHQFSKESIGILTNLWNKNKEVLESISRLAVLKDIPLSIDAVYLLWKLSNICQTLGINGYLLNKIAQDEDFEKLSIARNTVLGSFSSKYGDPKIRQEKLEPYQEIINKRKSDIFCEFIVSLKKDLKFKNRNDIYSFFLLDPEMGGCARISRIVSAISSLQLYVHRCLVNLEQSGSDPNLNPAIADIRVDPASIPKDQWEWRKNYRVWVANRKVFLYPENYLEPDLRDNKTPQFKELEDELLQQKITKESAEEAYRKYVSKYAELARLVISGAYVDTSNQENCYYFFGRTPQEPHQFYYRKLSGEEKTVWTSWEKIDLAINSDRISAIVHRGRLYIFWLEKIKKSKPTVESGNIKENWIHERHLVFSSLNEFGKWIPPQKLLVDVFTGLEDEERISHAYPIIKENIIIENPIIKENNIYISLFGTNQRFQVLHLNLFKNKFTLVPNPGDFAVFRISSKWLKIRNILPDNQSFLQPLTSTANIRLINETLVDWQLQFPHTVNNNIFPNYTSELSQFEPQVHLIGNKVGELILNLGNQQYHICYEEDPASSNPNNPTGTRRMRRLSTSLHDRLGEILFTQGIEKFLSLETQKEHEQPVGVTFIGPPLLSGPDENTANLDFEGAYGEYYRELFFHIPFLIAHYLNANQKFKDAKWWYERIFDPTSNESSGDLNPETHRNWQYIEFREDTKEKMKKILTNVAALERYKKDPFNPHAIARLRISAYQKTIVMKYIDNLLDWGDHLFTQDTMESINEASMLYLLAFDILGERPVKLGNCDSAMEEPHNLTYQIIKEKGKFESDFLVTLENWNHINNIVVRISTESVNDDGGSTKDTVNDIFKNKPEAGYYDKIVNERKYFELNTSKFASLSLDNQNVSHLSDVITNIVENSKLLFCIPENRELLSYWNRVEDRLFKIRNCMNISGVRRSLPLFQPPINPMLLVKAKAAGLALEDILLDLTAPPPLYRFINLIEKAKQFAQAVQNFGWALLGALEKKDAEELILLRSVHERNILNLTKEIKNKQFEESIAQHAAAVESRTNIQNRINYYTKLIEGGLLEEESKQLLDKQDAIKQHEGSNLFSVLASVTYLLPQLGSPASLNYGGRQLGDQFNLISRAKEEEARLLASKAESSGITANFKRREEDWNQQLILAQQELKQIDKQVLASEIRVQIAEKEIEIHDKNVEQATELDEFYRNKFTNLGLYNFLSTSMFRLYREAYNLAYGMALKAEEAYKFEHDDDTAFFILPDNWRFDRAGLLAGERLILQLQKLEKEFMEKNKRQNEITQSLSLTILNPQALLDLKEKGDCSFYIPELIFDLFYPGQYKRLIKSVRVTIPCVTGPYTNIGTKLTLTESWVRKDIIDITKDPEKVVKEIPQTAISTSSAQNDTGMFEFTFRDERYLPFEGAGAISKWELKLPNKIRLFDYDTISDVIIHISYTAEESSTFRKDVEEKIESDLKKFSEEEGLFRLVSLKHDFPYAFSKLLNPAFEGGNQVTEFQIGKNYFPYFLSNKDLVLSSPITIYLKPKGDDLIDTSSLTLVVNNGDGNTIVNSGSWTLDEKTKLNQAILTVTGKPDRKWILDAGIDGFDKEELDDIMILMKYKIQ